MTTIAQACADVLRESDPLAKVRRARAVARAWRRGGLAHEFDAAMPDAPGRPDRPELLPPNRMPKRGRGGSEKGRIALLHALAHIEFAAIDLAFDAAGRFGAQFPRSYVDDWISVGADEAMHFAVLHRRLRTLGSGYGELPAHAGLWEAAEVTAHDAMARLAVVPMVLEARGLDVTPAMIEKLRALGDESTAGILEIILREEVGHVAAGSRWFRWYCEQVGVEPRARFRELLDEYAHGSLRGPFNHAARLAAGFDAEEIAVLEQLG